MQKPCRSAIQNSGCAIALLAVALCGCTRGRVTQEVRKTSNPEPISVCELLENVTRYRSKMVSIRGVYWYGLRQSCPEPFVTDGHRWPSAVNLVDSGSPLLEPGVASFATDRQSWDQLDEVVLREARAGHREGIWVTVTGMIQAPASYLREDGQVVGGYGHLGVFPAELVVERVSDILIKADPSYDYREFLQPHGALAPNSGGITPCLGVIQGRYGLHPMPETR